jgi:DNA-binding transcriptional ArsR family regulator
MNVKVHEALRNETRFHLLKELKEEPLTYSHLMKKLGMDVGRDRGKFTYHLNILKDFGLIKQEGDMYRITEQGDAALVSANEKAEVAVHRSVKPPFGGLLLMLSGLLDILVVLAVPVTVTTVASVDGSTVSSSTTNFPVYVFITILFLLRIFTMAGGFVAISRRFWIVAILGGIVGIINFALTLGTILALVGTILIAISRKEFK